MTTTTQTTPAFPSHQKRLIAALRAEIQADLNRDCSVDRLTFLAYAYLRGIPYWRIEGAVLAPAPEGHPAFITGADRKWLPGKPRRVDPTWIPTTRECALPQDVRATILRVLSAVPAAEGETPFEAPTSPQVLAWMEEPMPYAVQVQRMVARRDYFAQKAARAAEHGRRIAQAAE